MALPPDVRDLDRAFGTAGLLPAAAADADFLARPVAGGRGSMFEITIPASKVTFGAEHRALGSEHHGSKRINVCGVVCLLGHGNPACVKLGGIGFTAFPCIALGAWEILMILLQAPLILHHL